ncbi:MAG: copper resistance system multicopper oxidase [Xanthomonadales bacterium]|nr:copper resistance system multicopper oxidase [Xanthomonadales bacterium]ODU92735.1 MAG: copper resistance protein CopA [Rhodanobacter sp. SCN 66-43]OJY83901.1 MAG: copper resistance protein CopA [Xanthomonadales bacterium 66-474]
MNRKPFHAGNGLPTLSRRRFVQGLALGGSAALLGGFIKPAWALQSLGEPGALAGTDFALEIGEIPVNFTGRARHATTVNGSLPGPLLRWREGTTVTLRVSNRLRVPTSIHWHGILLPFDMDGVPGISFPGIAPGETFVYRFPVRQSGTYWYHAHSGFEEQTGLYGALVIDPARPDRIGAERDYVVMLNDWTDEDPAAIFAHLKKQSDYYNRGELTARDFFDDVSRVGLKRALAERKMWNQMRMSPRDLVDVTGATYTYLMNGTTPAGNWTGLFKPGERVRLRFINGSSNSFFDVRIPGLKLGVVAADGQDVEPVEVDEFRIATAEVYDVIVRPQEDRAFTIFAQSMSRDGYARGTLAPRPGMEAEVPRLDPLPLLSMADMMGAMDHDTHAMPGMDHGSMPGMDMGGHGGMREVPEVHHARTEYHNPNVDMRVDMPRTNLDDPGVGLRDNGRRVLTYADLHTIGGSLYPQPVTREIELHLTGNMHRFTWGFDGLKFSQAKPVHFRYGEHLRIVLVNDTMMTHPIHLHGMWSELESPDQEFQVRKHTVSVQPAQRITYRVKADALGRWAWHCHLLYHMEAGMFREVVVS